MATRSKFGSVHTSNKLDKLESYLKAYLTALKKQSFQLIFFDAFAGTGDIQIGKEAPLLGNIDEYQPFIKGSTQRALQLDLAFHEYIFVEQSAQKVRELERLKAQYTTRADRIAIHHADANKVLQDFCAQRDWKKCRAVVFLDPFGNQVEWKTIVAVANTRAIDLWYLFPAGLGVHRQISRKGTVDKSHEDSLDRILGTPDWRKAFMEAQPHVDLFDAAGVKTTKTADPQSITRFMVGRMKDIFAGGVLDVWLPLGSRNVHMYSLIFAWANPSEKAKLAGKLAEAVLRSGNRGRSK